MDPDGPVAEGMETAEVQLRFDFGTDLECTGLNSHRGWSTLTMGFFPPRKDHSVSNYPATLSSDRLATVKPRWVSLEQGSTLLNDSLTWYQVRVVEIAEAFLH